MKKHNNNLIWLDLEMTGLFPDKDHILEIATVITDSKLNILAEGPVIAVHQPQAHLDKMDTWCQKQHGKTGLTTRVQASGISVAKAEEMTLEFIKQYVPEKKSPMCGNSICQDRRFLYQWMPKLENYFHYRNLDVSTFKELAQRWSPQVVKSFKKANKHEALADIYESIGELQHYCQHLFKPDIFN